MQPQIRWGFNRKPCCWVGQFLLVFARMFASGYRELSFYKINNRNTASATSCRLDLSLVIVFDLDDTLYRETDFVFSGFEAVAKDLSPQTQLSEGQILRELQAEFFKQRSQVFDRFLGHYGLLTKKRVARCVSVYRSHAPKIALFPEAKQCLERFKDYPLYVLTDGNQRVQRNKFSALGLASAVKKCLCTYAYGIKYQKPSPYCFHQICEWEKVKPAKVVYIGDNPYKDFVGIKPLGFQTIRVLQGPYKNVFVPADFNAHISVDNLNEIGEKLLFNLKSSAP